MPHSIPEMSAPGPWMLVLCLSKIRHITSTQVQMPAAVITPPSPPGTWNALPSARWNKSNRTPAATSSTAASTNENAAQPDTDTLTTGCFVPVGTTTVS
jgi:hypothetical protein